MHGVRRGRSAADAAEAAAAAAHAAGLYTVTKAGLAARRRRSIAAADVAASTRALEANPDEYSLWALRYDALVSLGASVMSLPFPGSAGEQTPPPPPAGIGEAESVAAALRISEARHAACVAVEGKLPATEQTGATNDKEDGSSALTGKERANTLLSETENDHRSPDSQGVQSTTSPVSSTDTDTQPYPVAAVADTDAARAAAIRSAEAILVTAWKADLSLTARCLRAQPKSYPTWQHRIQLLSAYAVAAGLPAGVLPAAIAAETRLSETLLAADARNFHGWAHRLRSRRLAAGLPGADSTAADVADVVFTRKCIDADFTNYSAWHRRSVVLPRVASAAAAAAAAPQGQAGGPVEKENAVAAKMKTTPGAAAAVALPPDVRAAELALVRDAVWTEPALESAWVYHRWLVTAAGGDQEDPEDARSLALTEAAGIRQLLAVEPDAVWALRSLAALLAGAMGNGSHAAERGKELAEAADALTRAASLDSLRGGLYAELLADIQKRQEQLVHL
ncbi:hypothetical protein MMPV_005904 [Pyropia vietnamensis]